MKLLDNRHLCPQDILMIYEANVGKRIHGKIGLLATETPQEQSYNRKLDQIYQRLRGMNIRSEGVIQDARQELFSQIEEAKTVRDKERC